MSLSTTSCSFQIGLKLSSSCKLIFWLEIDICYCSMITFIAWCICSFFFLWCVFSAGISWQWRKRRCWKVSLQNTQRCTTSLHSSGWGLRRKFDFWLTQSRKVTSPESGLCQLQVNSSAHTGWSAFPIICCMKRMTRPVLVSLALKKAVQWKTKRVFSIFTTLDLFWMKANGGLFRETCPRSVNNSNRKRKGNFQKMRKKASSVVGIIKTSVSCAVVREASKVWNPPRRELLSVRCAKGSLLKRPSETFLSNKTAETTRCPCIAWWENIWFKILICKIQAFIWCLVFM